MVRADYGGDGKSATREGTLIYLCDRFDVLSCQPTPEFVFEAGWNAAGASCVARPRIPDLATVSALAERYPRLAGKVGTAACDEERALADPATLLINRSPE
jgi:hypothetical protein